MDIMEKLKKVPRWIWGVAAAGIAGAVLLLNRSNSGAVMISPPERIDYGDQVGGGGSSSPAPPAVQPVDLSPLAGIIDQLAKGQRQVNESIARLSYQSGMQTQALLGSLSEMESQSPVTPVPTVPTLADTARRASSQETREINVWVSEGPYSGYISDTVVVDNTSRAATYEKGILDAKASYGLAESRGDQAGMDAAHSLAQRYRAAARDAGVVLSDWATRGANDYTPRTGTGAPSAVTNQAPAVAPPVPPPPAPVVPGPRVGGSQAVRV